MAPNSDPVKFFGHFNIVSYVLKAGGTPLIHPNIPTRHGYLRSTFFYQDDHVVF